MKLKDVLIGIGYVLLVVFSIPVLLMTVAWWMKHVADFICPGASCAP